MILLLDDCPRRHEVFQREYGRVKWCPSASAAVEALKTNRDGTFESIHLDHDLGAGQPTGMAVAEAMAKDNLHDRTHVYIHSSNYTGAFKMLNVLKKTHVVDFAEVPGCEHEGEVGDE